MNELIPVKLHVCAAARRLTENSDSGHSYDVAHSVVLAAVRKWMTWHNIGGKNIHTRGHLK